MSPLQEHTNLPKPGSLPFAWPQGYFDTLPQRLLLRIKAESNKQHLPEGYFDYLPDHLLQRILHAEAPADNAATAAWLQQLPRSMPFAVPQGYFDHAVSKAAAKRVAPVRLLVSGLSWAAAACLVGLLGLSLWLGYRQGTHDAASTDFSAALANLPDDLLNQALEPRDISLGNPLRIAVGWQEASASLQEFTEAELDNYLQQSGLNLIYNN